MRAALMPAHWPVMTQGECYGRACFRPPSSWAYIEDEQTKRTDGQGRGDRSNRMDATGDSSEYDLAIIGGGINGCGIARDAAGRGWRVFLCERADLASGTSSASTKLIHGGLRYLEHYEFRLVREALMEREVLWGIAPHIIWPLRFVLPHHRTAAPRLAAAVRSVHLRPSRRPETPAADPHRAAERRPRRRDAETRIHPRLRILRLLGGGFAPGGAERPRRGRTRGDDRDPHRLRLGGTRRGPMERRVARRGHRPASDHPRQGAGQRRRPLGRRGGRFGVRAERSGGGPAGPGQPYRGAAAVRSRLLLYLPECRRPHRLRYPLRTRLHADRNHRPGLHRRPRRCPGERGGDRLSVPIRQRLSAQGGHARHGGVVVCRRPPAVR